jgi:hypothetical protein
MAASQRPVISWHPALTLLTACSLLSGCGTTTESYLCAGTFAKETNETPATIYLRIEEYSPVRRLLSPMFGGSWSNAGRAHVEAPEAGLPPKFYFGLESNDVAFTLYEDSDRENVTPTGEWRDSGVLLKLSGELNLWVSPVGRFEGKCAPLTT